MVNVFPSQVVVTGSHYAVTTIAAGRDAPERLPAVSARPAERTGAVGAIRTAIAVACTRSDAPRAFGFVITP